MLELRTLLMQCLSLMKSFQPVLQDLADGVTGGIGTTDSFSRKFNTDTPWAAISPYIQSTDRVLTSMQAQTVKDVLTTIVDGEPSVPARVSEICEATLFKVATLALSPFSREHRGGLLRVGTPDPTPFFAGISLRAHQLYHRGGHPEVWHRR